MISWDAPYNGGSDITSYQIFIGESDESTFTYESSMCDGSDASIVSSRSCLIPNIQFTYAPFSLSWGDDVYAKIVATNIKGNSAVSDSATGSRILKVPDAPINLLDDPSVTVSSQIKFSWSEGSGNGGSPVIDYKISFSESGGVYQTLETGITDTFYIAQSLTAGLVYGFKVQARNTFGYSLLSEEVLI